MTNIENGQNIIIEGCYLPPEHIKDFEPEYLEQIIALYIGFSMEYLKKNYISGIVKHRSEIELRAYDGHDDYISLDNLSKLHAKLKERCKSNDLKFFEIHNHYEEEMKNIYIWLDEQVRYYKDKKHG